MSKVLIVAPYIFHEDIPEFRKNRSGLGRIISQICKEVAKENETYLITNTIVREQNIDGYKICSHTRKDIFKSVNPLNFLSYFKSFLIKNKFKDRLRYVYYYVTFNYIKKSIKIIKPDLVILQGIFYINNLCIDYFLKNKIPFTICIHGQINNSNTINANKYLKNSEGVYLKRLNDNNIKFCVIGSGIKNDICKRYDLSPGNIAVINNGVAFNKTAIEQIDLRKKYGLNGSTKIILYVSSLNPNKNQLLLLEIMKRRKNKDLVAFIIGDGDVAYKQMINQKITEYGLCGKVIMVGNLDRNDLIHFYMNADFNVLLSFYEGFGLSIAEGYCFGIPALTFADLGATDDLFNEKCMIKIEQRELNRCLDAFDIFISKQWNKQYIIAFSKRFSVENMGIKYREFISSFVSGEKVK